MTVIKSEFVNIEWDDTLTEAVKQKAMIGLEKLGDFIIGQANNKYTPTDTGTLNRSGTVERKGDKIILSFNTPYARIHHEGGTIAIPGSNVSRLAYYKGEKVVIASTNKKAFAFDVDGKKVFTKSITIKAKKYLEKAFNENINKANQFMAREIKRI